MADSISAREAYELASRKQDEFDYAEAERIYVSILMQTNWEIEAISSRLSQIYMAQGRQDELRIVLARLARVDRDAAHQLQQLADGFIASRQHETAGYLGTVVMPAYNAAATICRALDSVAEAMRVFRQQSGDDRRLMIAVTDDASSDDTGAICRDWARRNDCADFVLVRHGVNRGAAAARNSAARVGKGDLIWFLDADDRWLPDHVLVTTGLLARHPDTGMVRTNICFDGIDDSITPAWRQRNIDTHTINLCVRRSCHEFVEGFPEDAVFRRVGGEDSAYGLRLASFFRCLLTRTKTVFYARRPGNALDGQAERFTTDAADAASTLSEDEKLRSVLSRAAIYRLQQKTPPDGLPPVRTFRWPWEYVIPAGEAPSWPA